MSTLFEARTHGAASSALVKDDNASSLSDLSWGAGDDDASAGPNPLSYASPTIWAPAYAALAGRGDASASPSAEGDDASGGSKAISPNPQTVHVAGNITFVNTYDSSDTSKFQACIVAAESMIENLLVGEHAVTIAASFAESSFGSGSGDLLTNKAPDDIVSFAQLESALPSTDVLPSSDPSGGKGDWGAPEAWARMLGLPGATSSGPDINVSLNTDPDWSWGQDVIDGVTHELTEGALGREGALGYNYGFGNDDDWQVMDLFRYSAAGKPNYTDGRDGQTVYFSSNGGATLSNQNEPQKGAPTLTFNNQYNSNGTFNNGGDTMDWNQQAVFGYGVTGETLTLTQTELDVMNAVGWTITLQQDIVTASGSINWETPTAWSLGSMPIEPMDAAIGGITNTVNVTISDPGADDEILVNSIAVNAASKLTIAGGNTLTAVHGTFLNTDDAFKLYSGNLGTIDIDPNATLLLGPDELGTEFDNQGTLNIGYNTGSGGNGTLDFGTGDQLTFSGSGTVNVGGYADRTFSTGNISGDDLVNDDNTIIGGGSIKVTALDNQAGGTIDANQSEGDDLALNVSGAFSNEGRLDVEGRAKMDFGASGATRTLANTGSINLGFDGKNNGLNDAYLAIGGNFTLTGSGELNFKGAGAAIISNNAGSDTFTNQSTIVAYASGQIGDNGVYGGAENHLTFVNQGNAYADGSGVTLTLETAGHTIADGGGAYLLEADDDATLAINSAVTTGETYYLLLHHPAPTAGTIEATTGGTVDIAASVTAGVSAKFPDFVASGQVVVGAGSFVVVQSGGSVAISIDIDSASGKTAGGVLTLQSGGAISGGITFEGVGGVFDDNATTVAAFDIYGGGGTIHLAGSGDTVAFFNTGGTADSLMGSQETIDETGGNVGVIGISEIVNFSSGSGDDVALSGGGSSWDTVYGSGGTITVNDSQVSVVGGSDTINATAGSKLSLYSTSGDWDAVTGSGAEVILTTAQAAITGGSNTIYANAASSASLFGTSGDWDAFNGSKDQIVLTKAQAAITGESNTISATTGSSMSLFGTSGDWDAISGAGDQIVLSNAQSEITGGSDTISATTGSSMSIFGTSGAWDTFTGASDQVILTSSQASIVGQSNSISATTGSSISLYSTSGHADIVTGSSDTLALTSAQAGLTGNGDTIAFAGTDTLVVTGTSENFDFAKLMGLTGIGGFGLSDVIHLSAADWSSFSVLQASGDLKQSGANTLIALDAADTITLANVTASTLTSAQFKFA